MGGEPVVNPQEGPSPQSSMRQSLAQMRRDTIARCGAEVQSAGRRLMFGMITSLALQSVPLPSDCDLDMSALHVVASCKKLRITRRPAGHPRGEARSYVWGSLPRGDNVRIASGIYALDLRHTWAQLAGHMPLASLVALGDSIISVMAGRQAAGQRRAGAEIRDDLIRCVSGLPKFKGKAACLQAAALIVPNVDSPWETASRLALCRHGIPSPVVNHVVRDLRFQSGALMTLDMAWPEYRVAVEYDGDHHRTDKAQWRRDQEKRVALGAHGWQIVTITADTLRTDSSRAEFAFVVARHLMLRKADFVFRPVAMPIEMLADRARKQRDSKAVS
ncbi:hypothetical protein CPA40_09410 [Bifidobacterium callitrichos]|uniref:DUF559 domain-containing protein n=2 Tax=Bifidobacterium callitrichos TaxID=762209 RepID=A0A2T3G8D8_9BIFI|nr:hypothetical protein CPA40_09410 [Bifidobacterium callitrichos]